MSPVADSVHHKRVRSIALFLSSCICTLISIAFILPMAPVEAASSVSMTSMVGFSGYYSEDEWVPVILSITNHGAAVQAELQVTAKFPMGAQQTTDSRLHWSLSLPAKDTVVSQISVPGDVIRGNAVVSCYVGGDRVATSSLSGTPLGKVSLVAVLSPRAQDAQFLTGSSNGAGGDPVLPVAVNPQMLPSTPDTLGGLTAVAATPFALAELNASQSAALDNWVRLGGLLIVTGSGAINQRWDPDMPLNDGPVRSVQAVPLAAYAGQAFTPPKDVTVHQCTLDSQAVLWAGAANQPLVAAMTHGRGHVVQTAFSPMQASLLAWPGNASLWTNVLQQGGVQQERALPGLFNSEQVSALASASDALSPLRIPSLRFWAAVFAAYVLLIGPVVFSVLRRWKVEPWAWVVLPIVSLITTVSIYTIGASQRPNGLLTEGVGVLDLVGAGEAEAYGIRSFISPNVSSVRAVTQQPMMAVAMSGQTIRQAGSADVYFGQKTAVSLADIGRWNVRYVYSTGTVHNQGLIDLELSSTLGLLVGNVHNDTPYQLRHVAVCWNGHMYIVGDMSPGATVAVNANNSVPTAGGGYLSAYGNYNKDLTRGIGRALAAYAAPSGAGLFSANLSIDKAMVVATIDNSDKGDLPPSLATLRTGERIASDHSMVLVREYSNVSVYPVSGVSEI